MVAMVGLLTALPKTPLFERLRREGRLVEGAAHGDNTRARTNLVPKNMTAEELGDGYVRLYRQLLGDAAIARRIRNKLAHFGFPPKVKRESLREAAAILLRLLWHGILHGNPLRAWHFARSLPLARPRLIALAVNDWIAGLAMRQYAERHLMPSHAKLTAAEAFARLRSALRGWRRKGMVRVALRESQLMVRITGRLEWRLARRLSRQLQVILERSRVGVVVALETRGARAELERLSQALARHGDRVSILLGRGLNDLQRAARPI
jgi:hypothetical protein